MLCFLFVLAKITIDIPYVKHGIFEELQSVYNANHSTETTLLQVLMI